MNNFEVEFYMSDDGTEPVIEFLSSIDKNHRAKIVGLIGVLEEKGNELRGTYSEHLNDGIFELRCQLGNNHARILYFFFYGKKIVLTNGFLKKTNKTPKRELELAKKYRDNYLQRMKGSV
ncbi:MAG: type II toxin-antitoxin system RelE/ParE family toxin [Firmicutes bacterium]|nr:type II toxin-antitoxin system RelE/ParE family toxin [Bacillota bacterium]